MIRLAGVVARAAPYSLSNLSLEAGAGMRSVLGKSSDGAALVLAVLAGWVRPRAGEVRVLDGSPKAARRQIAYVPSDVRLPPSLRVREVLDVAASLREERAPLAPALRLESLGIAALADRWTHSLAIGERRAVALAEALTSSARVLLLDEPLVDLDPRASTVLASVLRRRAEGGASIVVATSSPRDAIALSDEQWVLDRGRLVATVRAGDPSMFPTSQKTRLHVLARGGPEGGRALLAALAKEPSLAELEMDGDAITLRGTDATAMAESVSRAALEAGVELELMRLGAPTLDEVRVAAAKRALRPALTEAP